MQNLSDTLSWPSQHMSANQVKDTNMAAAVSHENTPTLLDYFGTLLHCILCHAPLFILYLSFLPGVRDASPSYVLTEPPGGDARRILNY